MGTVCPPKSASSASSYFFFCSFYIKRKLKYITSTVWPRICLQMKPFLFLSESLFPPVDADFQERLQTVRTLLSSSDRIFQRGSAHIFVVKLKKNCLI